MKILINILSVSASVCIMTVLLIFILKFFSINNFVFNNYYANMDLKTFERAGISFNDGLNAASHLFKYLNGEIENLDVKGIVNSAEINLFSDTEVVHLDEVRVIYSIVNTLQGILFVVFLICFLSIIYFSKNYIMHFFNIMSIVSMIYAILAIMFILFWQWGHFGFYNFLHDFVFKTGLWTLMSGSGILPKIITIFFIKYVVDISLIVFIAISVILFICINLFKGRFTKEV